MKNYSIRLTSDNNKNNVSINQKTQELLNYCKDFLDYFATFVFRDFLDYQSTTFQNHQLTEAKEIKGIYRDYRENNDHIITRYQYVGDTQHTIHISCDNDNHIWKYILDENNDIIWSDGYIRY